ncbi:MAG: phenylacetate-CoA oxygenase subunit PaaJ [Burkholderiales bacterium]|nr:phenylacetate-CoA oxygenase subunit PaaJ [Burkholderiales bacterium]
MLSEADAWRVLRSVPDPELPGLSVCELGIVRAVVSRDDAIEVVVTPTYSGCPAAEVIVASIREALRVAGAPTVQVTTRLAPPWTTDWIEPEGARKLLAWGIVPPGSGAADGAPQPIRFVPRPLGCPRCGSRSTTRLSAFGSTACKALWRCDDCREPFEQFKPI